MLSVCASFLRFKCAGVDALRCFAGEYTGNLLQQDIRLTRHAQVSKTQSRSRGPPSAPLPRRALPRARSTRARGRRAQHVLHKLFPGRGVRPPRQPFQGAQPDSPFTSRSSPPALSLSLLSLHALPRGARRRTLTRVRRHDLPASANTAGHWLVGTVLASALGGAARRGQSSVMRRRLARCFQHEKRKPSPQSRSTRDVDDPKVRSTAARRRSPN
jgi:hypothetical protein